MRFLKFLHRDHFNMIDFMTAIGVIIFIPNNGWHVAAFIVINFTANVLVGTFIRWGER